VESIKAALASKQRKGFLQRRRASPSGRRLNTQEPPFPFTINNKPRAPEAEGAVAAQ